MRGGKRNGQSSKFFDQLTRQIREMMIKYKFFLLIDSFPSIVIDVSRYLTVSGQIDSKQTLMFNMLLG